MAKANFAGFFATFPSRTYKKNWSIVNPGDNLRTIYYIKKGYVRLYSISGEGEELTFIVYKPGEFFPLVVALFPPAPYAYWMETMTPSEIVSVPVESFKAFLDKHPELFRQISVEVMARLDRILRRMENLVFGTVSQRISLLILILCERFGKKVKDGISIEAPFTHKDIASLAGVTRETTSAIMSDLKKRGLIDNKNQHILVKDIAKLTKESLVS